MSTKLLVYNIPTNLNTDDFRASFRDLKGFLDARLSFNEKNNMIYGQLDFVNFECADHCKKLMQNFKFPGSTQGIMIDFLPQQENSTQDYFQYNANPTVNSLHSQLGTTANPLNYATGQNYTGNYNINYSKEIRYQTPNNTATYIPNTYKNKTQAYPKETNDYMNYGINPTTPTLPSYNNNNNYNNM